MFQLEPAKTQPFEEALLRLFGEPLSKANLSSLIGGKRLNLAKSYSSLKRKVKNYQDDAVTFRRMLNNLVNQDKVPSQEISHRLLQMFWHDLSPVKVDHVETSTGSGLKNAGIWYTFQLHNYGKDNPNSFLFQLARHIYPDSKLEE